MTLLEIMSFTDSTKVKYGRLEKDDLKRTGHHRTGDQRHICAEVNKSTTYNPNLTVMMKVHCLFYPAALLYIEYDRSAGPNFVSIN